jgi:hypothetical protein
MNLNALSRGHAAPDASFEGAVHSIFRTAFNIRLRSGTLLSVLTSMHANQPRAFRIDAPQEFQFDHYTFHIGDSVVSCAGIIEIPHRTLTIDFRTAVVWRDHLDSVFVDFSPNASRAAWHLVASMVLHHPASSGGLADTALAALKTSKLISPSPLKVRAFQAIRELVRSTRDDDINGALDASTQLIGLGPGLTPSGDDLLAGYITGLWTTVSMNTVLAHFTRQLGSRLAPQLYRTTDISAGFLRDAIYRTASETIVEMLRSIAEGQPPALVERATHAALNVGSTSGVDTVAGVLVGLAACNDSKLAISDLQT